jgi:serine/threonine protein kinase
VPGYRLLSLLGKGTFGEVWRASGPGGTDLALKVIPLEADSGLKELRALAWIKNIKHPHLLPITGLWLLDDEDQVMDDGALQQTDPASLISKTSQPATLIVAMLLGDRSLLDLHKAYQRRGETGIPQDELLTYIDEAALGLDFMNESRHDLGKGPVAIQHRDVKPENLLLIGGSTVVADFGVARVLDQQSVTATSMVGSPAYMAPECINGEHISRTTDQYSLALTYYFLRTGSLPFHDGANYFSVINCHVRGDLDLSKVRRAERRVLERATALDPSLRYNVVN